MSAQSVLVKVKGSDPEAVLIGKRESAGQWLQLPCPAQRPGNHHLLPQHRVLLQIETMYLQMPGHISDHDLERYHLGMVKDESELATLEEHLPSCAACVDRAEKAADYVDALRAAACELDAER
jgi:hypothetical protein